MISFTLPRFRDQSLDKSRKERWYPGLNDTWIAKLDTVVHELYHIDPEHNGIRRIDRGDGTLLGALPQPSVLRAGGRDGHRVSRHPSGSGRVRFSAARLRRRSRRVTAASSARASGRFRPIPSGSSKALAVQPSHAEPIPQASRCEPIRKGQQPMHYTENDLHIRQFMKDTSRRLVRKGQFRAA